ncbi:hypothetical protein WME75_00565 [Sorangium sp. So ce1014]|uniref:hypothetical protein n=1 Tax=Sorangium sp. So ce1014 TaxID=3133326 RepID=UPI003F6240B9
MARWMKRDPQAPVAQRRGRQYGRARQPEREREQKALPTRDDRADDAREHQERRAAPHVEQPEAPVNGVNGVNGAELPDRSLVGRRRGALRRLARWAPLRGNGAAQARRRPREKRAGAGTRCTRAAALMSVDLYRPAAAPL